MKRPARGRNPSANGNESGSELDDWLQAEEEIRRAEEASLDEH